MTVGKAGGPLANDFTADLEWTLVALQERATARLDDPAVASLLLPKGGQLVFGCLPTAVSRHNSPAQPNAISTVIKGAIGSSV